MQLGILGAYEDAIGSGYDLPEGVHDGRDASERMRDQAVLDAMEDVARVLAGAYRHKAGYQEHWGGS